MKTPRFIFPAICMFVAGWPGVSVGQEKECSCDTCHATAAKNLAGSIHEHLRCQECHGGQREYKVPADRLEQLTGKHTEGVTFDHGDTFHGAPNRLEIPEACGDCHADVERMNPYGLRTDQLAQYKTSIHGHAVLERKDTRAAVCTDCHGPAHKVLSIHNPASGTYPLNVPGTCAHCHANAKLMANYDIPSEIVSEYEQSVHGQALLKQSDLGAPTCATCHGNHSAMPPGFASVGAVCGQCHPNDAAYFGQSVHSGLDGFEGCVQCHGGGPDRHLHYIQRIVQPANVMIERYAQLIKSVPHPSLEQVRQAIHPQPMEIITQVLPSCTDCHDEVGSDENLTSFLMILDRIAAAERHFVQTANRLDEMSRGVLLVESQRFKFQDAKTRLIELTPLQHTLDRVKVATKAKALDTVCDEVNTELDGLQAGLTWRRKALFAVWPFAVCFAGVLYVKYRRLKRAYVKSDDKGKPPPPDGGGVPRRSFLNWLVGVGSGVVATALAVPALAYLWPAAKGGGTARVKVEGAATMSPGASKMVQFNGQPVIVVRESGGLRAFSAVCTHLGCIVKWHGDVKEFECPCHAGVFDKDGKVVSGPPPSPLPEYQVSEVGDEVFVSA